MRREVTVAQVASVRHEVRVEHCETVKLQPPASPISPVLATETLTSPPPIQHLCIAPPPLHGEGDAAKGDGNVEGKDEGKEDIEEEGEGELEAEAEAEAESDKDKDSDCASDNSSSTAQSEEEEEEDDDDEDEVEVVCEASALQETLTEPDIAYLQAVEDSDTDNTAADVAAAAAEVKLEITEDDTKDSEEEKQAEETV
jgi:hypothetical protein